MGTCPHTEDTEKRGYKSSTSSACMWAAQSLDLGPGGCRDLRIQELQFAGPSFTPHIFPEVIHQWGCQERFCWHWAWASSCFCSPSYTSTPDRWRRRGRGTPKCRQDGSGRCQFSEKHSSSSAAQPTTSCSLASKSEQLAAAFTSRALCVHVGQSLDMLLIYIPLKSSSIVWLPEVLLTVVLPHAQIRQDVQNASSGPTGDLRHVHGGSQICAPVARAVRTENEQLYSSAYGQGNAHQLHRRQARALPKAHTEPHQLGCAQKVGSGRRRSGKGANQEMGAQRSPRHTRRVTKGLVVYVECLSSPSRVFRVMFLHSDVIDSC